MQHTVFPTPDGISVAGAIIVKRNKDGSFAIDGREEEVQALLSAAYGKPVSTAAIGYIRRGSELLKQVSGDELYTAAHRSFPKPVTSGDNFTPVAKALMLFALSGLGKVEDSHASKQRLAKAQRALRRGVKPAVLLEKMQKAGFNPSEPRDEQGRWTTGGPSTARDKGSISSDDVRSNAHRTRPSSLPQGMQVAENDSTQSDAPATWGNPDSLQRHFDDHGGDFNASSSEDYANQANQFLQRGQQEKLPMIEYPNGGEIGVYDPVSNTFGIYTADGQTQSFYKPSSPTYFQRQMDYVTGNGGKIINPVSSDVGGMGGGVTNPEDIYHSDPFLDEEEKKPKD